MCPAPQAAGTTSPSRPCRGATGQAQWGGRDVQRRLSARNLKRGTDLSRPHSGGDGRGIATLVEYRDGRVDIVRWHGGSSGGSDIWFAKQNLPPIIYEGRLNPNLSDGPEWGATVNNAIRVGNLALASIAAAT